MRQIALRDDFLAGNYLSTELRVPVTLLETNACSSLATNALAGDIWDNFSSHSYKSLPSVGAITVHDPLTGAPRRYEMPAGGRGYIRPPSLISLWSSAPFLLNNSLGDFYWSGSVADRMKSFDGGIEQLLWPEKRKGDRMFVTASGKLARVTSTSRRRRATCAFRKAICPISCNRSSGPLSYAQPWLFSEGGIEIGPIPKGTPINLLSNIDLEQRGKLLAFVARAKGDLKSLPANASDADARQAFADLVQPLHRHQQMPGFRRQPRPLLRHRLFRRGAGVERRGQARADRVPEDAVNEPSAPPGVALQTVARRRVLRAFAAVGALAVRARQRLRRAVPGRGRWAVRRHRVSRIRR